MSNQKLTALANAVSPDLDTLLYAVVDPTGAATSVNISLRQLRAIPYGTIQMDTALATVPNYSAGLVFWHPDQGTLSVFGPFEGPILNIGEEMWSVGRNETGATIEDGKVTYVAGASGNRPLFGKALADSLATSLVIGVATMDIADNAEGISDSFGLLRGIDATGTSVSETWVNGQVLYVHPTMAGEMTNVKPSAPHLIIPIALILNAHITQGLLFVRAHFPTNLAAGSADGQIQFLNGAVLDADSRLLFDKLTGILNADLGITRIGTPTWKTAQDFIRTQGSSGLLSGGLISDAGSQTFDVSAGAGFIRSSDSHSAELFSTDWPASAGRTIADGEIRYIYVEYNAGVPQINDTLSRSTINGHSSFELGVVVREGTNLHISYNPDLIAHGIGHVLERFRHQVGPQRAEGLLLGETGTRNVTVTAGEIYDKLNEFDIGAIDTSGADTFDAYRNSILIAAGETQWPNLQYDTGSALADLTVNRYGVLWFYVEGDNGALVMVYGTSNVVSEAGAQAEAPPSGLPPRLEAGGLLIGRIIFRKSETTASVIETAFGATFSSSQAADHGDLAGLSDDDHINNVPLIISADKPAIAPTRAGQLHIDTTKGRAFFGVGSGDAEDFRRLDPTEDIFDNGTKGIDTIIDWDNGAVQSISVSAIINLSFTGWGSLAATGEEKAQSGTLIIIDGDLFEPTFDDVNQGPLPTYVAGFANVQELASLGPDGVIYNMWQVSNDQHVLLGADLVDDPSFDDSLDWVESANMSVVGGQLVLTAATSETTVEAVPLVAVATAVYLVTTIVDEVTVVGGGFKVNIGSADSAVHTTTGTKYDIITATDTDGLEITAAGAAMTAKMGSVTARKLF